MGRILNFFPFACPFNFCQCKKNESFLKMGMACSFNIFSQFVLNYKITCIRLIFGVSLPLQYLRCYKCPFKKICTCSENLFSFKFSTLSFNLLPSKFLNRLSLLFFNPLSYPRSLHPVQYGFSSEPKLECRFAFNYFTPFPSLDRLPEPCAILQILLEPRHVASLHSR